MQLDFWDMLGYTNNAHMMMEAFGSSSNVILTDNPPYSMADFSATFPVFKFQTVDEHGELIDNFDGIPVPVFNLFLAMANASIKYDRYKSHWKYCMALFIAHYLTLFLETQAGDPSSQAALQGAMPKGVATSKSVDGLSISYDLMGQAEDAKGYGTYKLTLYGLQLATLTRMYGSAGMWVNW